VGGTGFFFTCFFLLILSFRAIIPALMVLSGLFLSVILLVWIMGPLIALVTLHRLRKGSLLLGREEHYSLQSQRKILYSAALRKKGKARGWELPLFDLFYRTELVWFHRFDGHSWRRWEKLIPLAGESLLTVDVDREGLMRGDYSGRDGFLLTDWFGFFCFSLVSSRSLHVTVTGDQLSYTPRFNPSPQAEGVSSFVALPSEEELVENRPYYPGDDPRKINWKQYARFQDLFIRTAHDPLPNNKWVLLLLSGEGLKLLESDRAAAYYLGLCRSLQEGGCEVYTLIAGQDKIGLYDYSYLPAFAPSSRLILPVHSPGHIVLVGKTFSHDESLWRKQAFEQGIPFILFDPLSSKEGLG
jgi:hypothetical protein